MDTKKEYEAKEAKNLSFKTLKVNIKASDEGEGIVEARVSVFGNVDSYGEIVDKGAFLESLANKFPKGVWMHDWAKPIAKTLEAYEDDEGLYIKGKLIMEVQQAKEAYALMKEGVIDEFSIGYSVLADELDTAGYRHLKKIALYEWSPVLVGANPATELLGVKSAKKDTEDQPETPEAPAAAPEAAPEAPEAPQASDTPETDPEPQNDPEPTPEPAPAPQEPEEKEGRVLSEANRVLITDAIAAINQLKTSLKGVISPLNALLDATSKGTQKVEAEPVGQPKSVLRLRQTAKEAQKACEAILRITR